MYLNEYVCLLQRALDLKCTCLVPMLQINA